jgi:hypothetical protein
MPFRTTSIGAAVAAVLAVTAPVAVAQSSPVLNGYSTPAGTVQTQVQSKTPKSTPLAATTTSIPQAAAKPETSQLPFTGLDVGLVLAAAAMLIAAGFGIRRLSRPTGAV